MGREPVALDLNNEDLAKLLGSPFEAEWEGTCDLCGHGDQQLAHLCGVYMCEKCRNTIALRIKDAAHPFEGVRVTMDPAMRGTGEPGQRKLLLGPLLKAVYQSKLLENARKHPIFKDLILPTP